jgi:uncharacterized protein YecE (DUF72 family)
VYPADLPQRRWFEHYATRFDTVELNATFYRLPTPAAAESWGHQAPPGFVYAVKLGAFGSHRMKLRDASSWLPNHLDRVCRLGDALGPTLVQLPPRWRRDVDRLDEFLSVAPRSLRWAVEVREPSWLHDDVYAVLERHRAALCIHDLLEHHPWVRTTDWTYVRFHGPEALTRTYTGRYGGRRLWRAAARIATWADEGADAYVYFNNDVGGAAVADASWFRDRVGPAARPGARPGERPGARRVGTA